MTLADAERDAVIVACAVSAGIHAALAPGHLADGAAAGASFVAAAVALAALAAALTRRAGRAVVDATAALLAGLIVSYALAATSGLPVLHPDPEPVDGLGLLTKAVEAVGLLAAWRLRTGHRTAPALARAR